MIRDGAIHKIGVSSSPEQRLQVVASPAGVIVHLIPSSNPYQIENALHRRFADCRAVDAPGREWFNLSDEDIESICRLARTDALDDLPDDLQPPPRASVPSKKKQHNIRLNDAQAADLERLRLHIGAIFGGITLSVTDVFVIALAELSKRYPITPPKKPRGRPKKN